jgi:glycosyltransferase involved in cell wall biosynthesis
VKILYIHQYFSPRSGKTGTRSIEQALAMRAAGHEVVVLTTACHIPPGEVPPGKGRICRGRVSGIPAIVLKIPYDQRMGHLRRVWSFLTFMAWGSWLALTEPRCDLVFATSTPLTVGIPALLCKAWRRIPFVFEVRDLWPEVPIALGVIRRGGLARLLESLEKLLYRTAECVVAVNEGVAGVVRRKGARRVIVVPNACDTDLFRPDRDGSWFRREHGLEGKVVCIHAGAMGRVNHLGIVLDAAAALRDDDRLRFVLIGGGGEMPRLQARVTRERLTNALLLEGMPKTRLADVLATADVGLMTVLPIPILEMNCANKFFDYLAAGLPIVLNYGGWQADLLKKHDCGLAAPMGDTGAFVAAIRELADSPQRRARLGSNARRLAEMDLDRKNAVRPLLAWLDCRGAP